MIKVICYLIDILTMAYVIFSVIFTNSMMISFGNEIEYTCCDENSTDYNINSTLCNRVNENKYLCDSTDNYIDMFYPIGEIKSLDIINVLITALFADYVMVFFRKYKYSSKHNKWVIMNLIAIIPSLIAYIINYFKAKNVGFDLYKESNFILGIIIPIILVILCFLIVIRNKISNNTDLIARVLVIIYGTVSLLVVISFMWKPIKNVYESYEKCCLNIDNNISINV